ncbi:MAG: sigma-70 family RNA polymerase sigma factor [Planctomycetaceae bacterium]|nr:sigma-70 family RNA polymerase sigma factor [Planctomycetaceae bacterium]
MSDPHETRASLLVRIRDQRDGQAWSQFVEIYSPLIYGFGRKHGLQDADAVDLTQEVLRIVARTAERFEYDAKQGSFRGWLFTIVRNELRTWRGRQQRMVVATGEQRIEDLVDDASESALWDQDHERRLFAWAAEQVQKEVQPATWQAFWRTAVEGQSGKDVAADLEMSIAAVYLAKSRVMARLKELVKELD